jgi:hypothetical protein
LLDHTPEKLVKFITMKCTTQYHTTEYPTTEGYAVLYQSSDNIGMWRYRVRTIFTLSDIDKEEIGRFWKCRR